MEVSICYGFDLRAASKPWPEISGTPLGAVADTGCSFISAELLLLRLVRWDDSCWLYLVNTCRVGPYEAKRCIAREIRGPSQR